ncbi:MAG: hypothetical protein V4617_15190 [Gemmatimonadota bacterium]
MLSTQLVPEFVLQALRDPRLRRHHAASVYAEVWASLSFDEARVVKVGQLAETLGIQRREIRRALDLLGKERYLQFTHRDENRRRYYRLYDKRGAPRPPVAS